MRYVYITALIDVEIRDQVSVPHEINNNIFITNNPKHIQKFLKPRDVIALGSLEANLLFNRSAVVYKVDKIIEQRRARTEVINFLREVQAFLTAMWLPRLACAGPVQFA